MNRTLLFLQILAGLLGVTGMFLFHEEQRSSLFASPFHVACFTLVLISCVVMPIYQFLKMPQGQVKPPMTDTLRQVQSGSRPGDPRK